MTKLLRILFTLIIVYTLGGIPYSFANSITPSINEVKLPQGQRITSSTTFENSEDRDVEIILSIYEYDPKTENILKDGKNIFLKTDTDTFTVKKGSSEEIKYEIYPVSNLELGTYFNILVFTEVLDSQNVYINQGISQLVVLHVTDPDQDVKGITTDAYTINMEVVNKGIPFIRPAVIKYTLSNNSNYVLTPKGRADIFNDRGDYKPEYMYINSENKKIYPKEQFGETLVVQNWHISDIFYERKVHINIYNGLDSTPKSADITINSYVYEILGVLVILLTTILFIKSIRSDLRKKTKKAS